MSTPTTTPRTDAALYPMNGVEIVWPDFARTLEMCMSNVRVAIDVVELQMLCII